MKPDPSKLRHQSPLQSSQTQNEQQLGKEPLEFATPEELLRFDAAHTAIPNSLPKRLDASIAQLAPAKKSWWRRLLGLQQNR